MEVREKENRDGIQRLTVLNSSTNSHTGHIQNTWTCPSLGPPFYTMYTWKGIIVEWWTGDGKSYMQVLCHALAHSSYQKVRCLSNLKPLFGETGTHQCMELPPTWQRITHKKSGINKNYASDCSYINLQHENSVVLVTDFRGSSVLAMPGTAKYPLGTCPKEWQWWLSEAMPYTLYRG